MILYSTFLNTFLASSLFCFMIDMTKPHLRYNGAVLSRWNILKDYGDMLPLVTTNAITGYPFFSYVENKLLLTPDFVPNQWAWWTNLCAWILMTDLIFYSVHWMLHQRTLYKYIHSVHHQYRYTYGIGAIYAHPLEFYIGNLVPVAMPLVICKMPMNICQSIVIFATLFTVVLSHGGFIVSKSHLNHHLKYRCNYGLVFMDKVLGTKNYDAIEIKHWESEPELEIESEPELEKHVGPHTRSTWL